MDAAPKPAEPRKPEPAPNASLFDIGPATATQLPISDADDEEEILAEATEDEPTDESLDFDEAA